MGCLFLSLTSARRLCSCAGLRPGCSVQGHDLGEPPCLRLGRPPQVPFNCVCSASQTCFHLFSSCICTIPAAHAAYRDLHDTAACTARAARDCLAACCDQTYPSQHLTFSLLLQSLLSPNCSRSTTQYHAPSSSQVCHRKAHACVR